MNSRSCRWLIVPALLITASGARAPGNPAPFDGFRVNVRCQLWECLWFF